MKLSVHIVSYNSQRYLYQCLDSLQRQTFSDFSVLVVDNASSDRGVALVRSHFPTISVLENSRNLGFARAHNQAIQLSKAEYVLVLNPDVVLVPDFFKHLVAWADRHPAGGSFGGKMLRLKITGQGSGDADEPVELEFTKVLDTCGLQVSRGRHVADRGAGLADIGQFDQAEQVFGVSGTCVLYRRRALDAVAPDKEYFDEDFFAYKEDVDLAWRLRLDGWEAWYVPTAIGYHHRGFVSPEGKGVGAIRRHRKSVSSRLRVLSLKNHHLMLLKNEQWTNVLIGAPWLILREIGVLLYSLVVEPSQLRAWPEFFRQLPAALKKRRSIRKLTKVRPRDIRKWFR